MKDLNTDTNESCAEEFSAEWTTCVCSGLDGFPHFTFSFEHSSSLTFRARILLLSAFSSSNCVSVEGTFWKLRIAENARLVYHRASAVCNTYRVKAHKTCTNLLLLQETTIYFAESQPEKSGFIGTLGQTGALDIGWRLKAVCSKSLSLPLIQCFSEWFPCGRTFCLEILWVTMRNDS